MQLYNTVIPAGEKFVVFDADAYVAVGHTKIDIGKILQKEKIINIKAYASLWTLMELLSGGDINTLQIVDRHCADESNRWRFLTDPISQVYYSMYEAAPPYVEEKKKGIEDFFAKALSQGLTDSEKNHIKSQLAQAGSDFIKGCLNYTGDIRNEKPEKIQKYAIGRIIQQAKKVRGNSENVKDTEIDFFKNQFPAAGVYYEFLMKNILPQTKNKPNEQKLLHDQRDWHLFFCAGRDDVYIVTQEKKIKTLNLKNVTSLEEYCQKILHI